LSGSFTFCLFVGYSPDPYIPNLVQTLQQSNLERERCC
jgi:hypothetical protein